jgi:tartrate-resistant acid phosphatase type 5
MISSMSALTRRRALQQTFLFSAALALGSRARFVRAQETAGDDLHFLMIGDWGTGKDNKAQQAVAAGMKDYAQAMKLKTEGLLLLGDNFYGEFKGGVDCPRWKTEFEDMYPADIFPGPCWTMLGNHDYDDEPVDKMNAELAYAAAHPGTRWYLPSKWYRFEWPKVNPLITAIVVDSNYHNRVGQLTPAERAKQLDWLKSELARPRTTPWLVALGHHPLYSNGLHGDTKALIDEWGPLFQDHGVDFYFCGHDHDLQHLELEGLRTSFVLSGGGGARIYAVLPTSRGPYAQAVYGFTHLQVNREKFTVRHLDANQKLLHAFSKARDGKMEILS